MHDKRNDYSAANFGQLSYLEQVNLLGQRGVLLEVRRLPGFWLHLYALNTFFVETWVCQRRYETLLVRLLKDTTELEPYLDKVSIRNILPK